MWKPNAWAQFVALSAPPQLLVGEVLAHRTDGSNTSLIELPGGGHLVASGQSAPVGQMAIVRAGKVEWQAPSLPALEIEI